MAKKVLIVEYQKHTIDKLKNILKPSHFEVEVVADGDEAKKKLETAKFDMLITAAMIPKSVSFPHGFALSKYASETYLGLKIIILSGIYKGYEYKRQAVSQYKANNFFEKPLNLEEIQTYVCNLLGVNLNEEPPKNENPPQPKEQKNEEKESSKDELSSVDIFGDIIDSVEKDGANINKNESDNSEIVKESKSSVSELNKSQSESLKKRNVNVSSLEDRKTDPEISKKLEKTLSGLGLKSSGGKKNIKKLKKEIDKRFEETLSGLGLKKSKLKSEKKIKVSAPISSTPKLETKKVSKEVNNEKESMFDNYEVLGLINRGGMAEIYKARKRGVKGFEKIVAIKKIISGYVEDNNYIEMFVDEAKIAAELTHPNIVQIHDFGKKDDYYFIAMEYVQGKDLRVILKRLKDLDISMPEYIGVYIVQKLLEALSYAHTAKNSSGESLDIVHRDISPPNVIISYHGAIKLTDFGISKASNKLHQTISGALKGKLLYMSPEQARGEKDIDKRADIYSVGIMLYELITGKKAFLDNSEMAILSKVQKGNFASPSSVFPEIDPDLEKIIIKSLDKDKNKRYQSGGEMLRDLNSYIMERFSLVPDSQHMAAFIYQLFSEEIEKKNLKISKLNPPEIKIREREVKEKNNNDSFELDNEKSSSLPKEELKKEENKKNTVVELNTDTYIGPVEFNLDDDRFKSDDSENVVKDKDNINISVNENIDTKDKEESNIDNLENIVLEEEKTPEPPKVQEQENSLIERNDFYEDTKKQSQEISSLSSNNYKKETPPSNNRPSPTQSFQSNNNWGADLMGDEEESGGKSKKIIFILIGVVVAILSLYFLFNGSNKDKKNTDVQEKKITEVKKEKEKEDNQEESQTTIKEDSSQESNQKDSVAKEKEVTKKVVEKKKIKEIKTVKSKKIERKKTPKKAKPIVKKAPVKKKIQDKTQKQKKEEIAVKVPVKKIENKEQKKKEEVKEEIKKESTKEVAPTPVVPKVKVKEGDFVKIPDIAPVAVNTPIPMNRKIRKLMKKKSNNQVVVVSLLIDHKGNVKKIKFIKRPDFSLISEITSFLYSWKYKPAKKDGVSVNTRITKTFTLKK